MPNNGLASTDLAVPCLTGLAGHRIQLRIERGFHFSYRAPTNSN